MNGVSGNIALLTSAHVAAFNIALCARLKQITGRKIIFYVQGAESVRKHRRFVEDGTLDEVVDCGLFHARCFEATESGDVFERARRLEDRLGVSYNTLFMARREAGRGFALGGLYHPRSPFSDRVTYRQLVHGQSEMLDFWQREIERNDIGLFLNGTLEIDVVCREMGISFRTMYSARYRNRFYWAHDVRVAPPGIEQAYIECGEGEREPVCLDTPYKHEVETRKLFVGENGLARFVRFAYAVTLRNLYLRFKGYRTPATNYLSDSIRYHWNYYRGGQTLRPPLTVPLASIKDRPFVFFPLQTEPEFSLQVMSPECFCQLGVIASLARDLPAGVLLAVKETIWGLGRRPADFYRQISEFKNVVLLDVREQGLEVVKRSAAVATISGSAGIEAALIGRPAILFGRHNGYGFLPHVAQIGREEDLKPALERVFAGKIEPLEAVQAGARYGAALERISFDLGSFAAFKPETWVPEHAVTAVENLLVSLAHGSTENLTD